MTTLDDIIDQAGTWAKTAIEKSTNSIPPNVLILDINNQLIFTSPVTNGDLNLILKPALTALLQSLNARMYVFMCEAWMTASKRVAVEHIKIKDLPPDDRERIVMIVAGERGKKARIFHAVIGSTPSGRMLGDFCEQIPGFTTNITEF